MRPSVGKKLSFFVAITVMIVAGAIGYVSYTFVEAKFAEILRKDTLDAATLLASRVRNELRHVAEKGRFLSAAALEEFKNPEDQIRFLEENLAIDDQFIALSLFRRSSTVDSGWDPVFRLSRPEGDPSHLEEDDFKQLDLKYPVDINLVAEGAVEVSVGALKDGTPILRLAVPIVRKKGKGFSQLLEMEVRQERITAAFAEATAHFSFILDRHGRVLTQTDPTHFTLGEDLSHLPILQMAKTTDAPNGNLDYYELPGSMLQYGSFHKVGYADLTIVSQAPRTHIIKILRDYTRQSALLVLAGILAATAFALVAAWGIVGGRLARIGRTLGRIGDGKFDVKFPDVDRTDEIGDFARKIQSVCDELSAREQIHGTYAKLSSRRAKARLSEGKVNTQGERAKAFVLYCHIKGLDELSHKADPELFISLLNRFNSQVSDMIEDHHGIIDHIQGGHITAFWGVPIASDQDADHLLAACLGIRECGVSFNESLSKAKLSEVTLSIGIHYGQVITGQVGTSERMEYTAFGEALEVATSIETLTEQFGTDILMTEAAAGAAPKWYSTEKVGSTSGENPHDLFELIAALDRAQFIAETKKIQSKKTPGKPKKLDEAA